LTHTDIDSEDALIQAIQDDLERVVMREVCESIQTEKGSDRVTQKNIAIECNRRKNTVMKLLNASVRTQRLYFVLRSIFMGLISAVITFTVILYLGTIDFPQAIFLGIFVFTFSLMFSRLFDNQIVFVSMKIISFLEKHDRIRNIVLRTF
jgi:hypothetical protein